jgi:ceramide glucosyltransferase
MLMAWLIIGYSVLASSCALFLALRLARTFRFPEDSFAERPQDESLSILIPIKGVDRGTHDVLQGLVSSVLSGKVEFVFGIESDDDPAFSVCDQLRNSNLERDIKIVISGEPRGLIGKQHNLAHAYKESTGQIIVCMDADIEVDPSTIREGLSYLDGKDVGSAFFLPVYRGDAPFGGRLVETYLNYHYNLFMGSLATLTDAPYIFGGLWMTRRSSLERTGGFESFGRTVSDDAAIGRAFLEVGLRNVLIPKTVHTPNENLELRAGLKHLGKWIGMLRAEGIAPYFAVWLWWHPAFWSVVFLGVGLAGGWLSSGATLYVGLGVALCLAAKTATSVILNLGVFRIGALHSVLTVLAYELLVVPLVLGFGLFRRSITWKGRRYRLGPKGMVLGLEKFSRSPSPPPSRRLR